MQRINNYYTATVNDRTQYAALTEDISCDIAIVGGGLTGVATAVELSERGYSVVLLEANRIGWGASGRNGGQVTGSLSGDTAMLKQLQVQQGTDAARFVWNLRWRGQDIIKQRISAYQIECDLVHGHLHTAWTKSAIPALKQTLHEADQWGFDGKIKWLDREQIQKLLGTELYHGGVYNQRNFHLHSLNLCLGEARAAVSLGCKIFEQTHVTQLESNGSPVLQTAGGKVTAQTVVLAGNAYHHLCQPQLKGLLIPAVLGNMTTEPLSAEQLQMINPKRLAVYDSRLVLDYYRVTADNRLMFGGGTNYSGREIRNVEASLRPALEKTFPILQGINIDYEWTCTAGIVPNRIPLLGRATDNVYYAQGYSGHGIASSHVLAEILADALQGELEQFETFNHFKHLRVPFGRQLGNPMMALGMAYYQLKERLLDK
jgi:glycine/D-amino acid oxidase-like deaminating enzyme